MGHLPDRGPLNRAALIHELREAYTRALLDSLAEIVRKHRPRVFGLSVTMPESGELLRLAIDDIRRGDSRTAVLVGGQGVPEDLRGAEGLVVARDVADVVEWVDALVRRPDLN